MKNKVSCLTTENNDLKKTIDVLKADKTLFNVGIEISEEKSTETTNPDIASNTNILKCDECEFVLMEGFSLRSHNNWYHHWKCDWCDFITRTQIDIENHVQAKH